MRMTSKVFETLCPVRTTICTAILCLIFITISAKSAQAAGLSDVQIKSLFHQAGALFHRADNLAAKDPKDARFLYQQAAMRYERITKMGGIRNGELYYDIGNAWFRANDIGRAILNYRRAMQYIPNDPNLRQNLAYAREKRLDRISEPQETKIFKTLFFWHYDFSTPFQILLLSIFFVAIWLLAGIRRFIRRPTLGWGLAAVIVLAAMMGGSLAVNAVTLRTQRPGVIIDPSVTARKGNGDAYASSFTGPIHAGTEFTLQEQKSGWDYIRLPDGRYCWVPIDSVEMVR